MKIQLRQLFCYLFLGVNISIYAQGNIYLETGLNMSTLTSDDSFRFMAKPNLYAGLTYMELFASGLDMTTAIHYSTKGVEDIFGSPESYSFLDGSFSLGFKFNNLVGMYGGLQMGALLSKNKSFIMRDVDLGALIGLKVDFDEVFVKFHYNHGLIKQSDFDSRYIINYQLGMGLKLNFLPKDQEPENVIIRNSTIKEDTTKLEAWNDLTGGQRRHYEISLRLNGFDRFDMIYKIKRNDYKYMRYSFFTSNVNYVIARNNRFAIKFGISFGPEYRSYLDTKTYFTHGPQFELAATLRRESIGAVVDVNPAFAYVIGIHHQASERFSIGVEILPRLAYSTRVLGRSNNPEGEFSLNFGTTNIGLVASYSFSKSLER